MKNKLPIMLAMVAAFGPILASILLYLGVKEKNISIKHYGILIIAFISSATIYYYFDEYGRNWIMIFAAVIISAFTLIAIFKRLVSYFNI